MKARTTVARAAALATLLALPLSSHAIFRAYVASTGNDANPCTLQAPCRLLPAALAAVDDGGEIWMLDSANYNTAPVTIEKSVTILATPGAVGSVVSAGGSAITVSGDGARVTLRNLNVVPFGASEDGIRVSAQAARVIVNQCEIAGMNGNGIHLVGNSRVHVVDSVVRGNNTGILTRQGVLHVSRTHILDNSAFGLSVSGTLGPGSGYVDSSVANGNTYGFAANSARLHITRSVASGNAKSGIATLGTVAVIEVSDSVSEGNGWYGLDNALATLNSAGNNRVEGNGFGPTQGSITESGFQ